MTKYPITPAIRTLRQYGVSFEPFLFTYLEKGGTAHSSVSLGVPEHVVIKTLIMETSEKKPLCILMHGDCDVSTKALARHVRTKSIQPCTAVTAEKFSGYQVGGTSPFGLRTTMPIYVEASILDLPEIYINGGGRGFLVKIDPQALCTVLNATAVTVAQA